VLHSLPLTLGFNPHTQTRNPSILQEAPNPTPYNTLVNPKPDTLKEPNPEP